MKCLKHFGVLIISVLLTSPLLSCSTSVTLPAVDLSAPGWTIWNGQALWKPNSDQPPIAGEIILARQSNGGVFISFAKPPVPIFSAQAIGKRWAIDFIHTQNSYSGTNGPPLRFVWFQIPALLQQAIEPEGWQVNNVNDVTWELQNPGSGEYIRLVLDI